MLKENPVMPLKSFKESASEETERRAFTPAEIKILYTKAPDDFWRYMVVAAFYSGLRMGDLITLKIGEIDFHENALRLTTGKTGRRMIIPIAKPLLNLLAGLIKTIPVNNPNRYLWPEQAPRYEKHGSNVFSNDFYKFLLVPAGLAPKRTHAKIKHGRGAKRNSVNVSFHSLRHSFVSYLKATGSNPAVARELAGHSSDLINNLYTHIPQSTLSDAIAKLPEVTK
jgi:integrase